jgi:hypothetical protein
MSHRCTNFLVFPPFHPCLLAKYGVRSARDKNAGGAAHRLKNMYYETPTDRISIITMEINYIVRRFQLRGSCRGVAGRRFFQKTSCFAASIFKSDGLKLTRAEAH